MHIKLRLGLVSYLVNRCGGFRLGEWVPVRRVLVALCSGTLKYSF